MSEQNIEFSSDENILIVKGGKREGEYQTKTDGDLCCTGCGFWAGDFFGGCCIGGMLNAHCSSQTRKDGKSIIWTKQEENKMTQKPEPRAHAELIKQWAEDISLKVYVWTMADMWEELKNPKWDKEIIYTVAKEKPTAPPTIKTIVKISLDATELTIELPIGSRKEEIEKVILDKAVQFINHNYRFGE